MADNFSTSDGMTWHFAEEVPVVKSVSEHCRELADFLRINPSAWCKGTGARSGDDSPVSPMSPWARQWCTLGLIERFVTDNVMRNRIVKQLMRVITPLHGNAPSVAAYNDQPNATVHDIIAMFECAALLPPDFNELMKRGGGGGTDAPEEQPVPEAYVIGFDTSALIESKVEQLTASLIKMPDWKQLTHPLPEQLKVHEHLLLAANEDMAKKLMPWSKIMNQIGSIASAA